MANNIYFNQAYTLINELASQVLGESAPQALDTTTFVSVGETVLRAGYENTLNAISQMVGRTLFGVRPYSQKLEILTVAEERWGGIIRKLTPLFDGVQASEAYNTYGDDPILVDDNSIDMYKIHNQKLIQTNFYGSQVMKKYRTRYLDQLSQAFTSESAFLDFYDMLAVEFANEIEVANEAKSRATLLNYMAGTIYMAGEYPLTENATRVVDLVAAYNEEFGTTWTRGELLSTYISDFMKFIAAEIKIYSSRLTDISYLYHSNIGTGDSKKWIPRHTPKARQKMVMYNPAFVKAESEVYSGLFNPQYLEIGNFEPVNFWQSPTTPTAINVKPNIMNPSTGASADAAVAVEEDYVLGMLFDEEALGVRPQFTTSSTTPLNSNGLYFNTFIHWRFQTFADYTENAIVFVLGEGGDPDEGGDGGEGGEG